MAEHDAVAGMAFPRAFAALTADGLRFVTFELSMATSLTAIRPEISTRLARLAGRFWPTSRCETSFPLYHLLGY